MSLTEIIKNEINTKGPISFRDFMEMCLYYPDLGYYSSDREKIGTTGDFYTSPYFTSLFGEMIAKQLEEMWALMGKQPFTIVEYGAGSGLLCHDILRALARNKPMTESLNYCIIEKSPAMRKKAKRLLSKKVSWYEDIGGIAGAGKVGAGIVGCILSNELIDNFSVHQVLMQDELMEIFVGYNDGFVELFKPAGAALKEYFVESNMILPKGYRTEINLQARDWIREVANALREGFLLTSDYGYSSASLYDPHRTSGTLACFHKHQVTYCPYNHIGDQDITAHVNFSALREWGLEYDLQCCGYTGRANFLRALGLGSYLKKGRRGRPDRSAKRSSTLLPADKSLMNMGNKFGILIQQKD